ncbi:MAG: hypothetical protein ABR567_10100 [Myxococcales bacterium]|nr:hypothetical protein [Myxococcales bacterium]
MRCCVLILAIACGGAPLDAQGNVGSTSFASVATVGTLDSRETVLLFSDIPITCADLAAGGTLHQPADVLYVLLWDVSGTDQSPATFTNAYGIGSNGPSVSKATFMRWTDSCTVGDQTEATTGTVQITSITVGRMAGNFTFGFPNGLLYGHFDVEMCPPLAETGTPLCF